ncbi:MAG: glycosyltransferase family 2 protein [bacterium]
MTVTPHQKSPNESGSRILAVLIPCYNEEITIGKVVTDFKNFTPGAKIYVFDNNSTDRTAQIARDAGAIVIKSPRQGKGNVVRHMLSVVDADLYIMIDGDDTYPADMAGEMIAAVEDSGVDMVVGMRLSHYDEKAFRRMHEFGNRFVAWLVSFLFSSKVTDILSGYRVFTKNFARNIYLKSSGFEVETEMTLQALAKDYVIKEVPIRYGRRPEGSISKLNTLSDGIHILKAIFLIFKEYKPLVFFSLLSAISFVLGLVVGWFPISDYLTTRYVSHVPFAILATALEILAVLFLGIGLILNTITRFHMESHELMKNLFKAVDKHNS